MDLTSPAFVDGGAIPVQYTCDGANISPPLAWSSLPRGTKSLALIVDDPDAPDPAAPKVTWVHWVLYNLPTDVSGLAANAESKGLPKGASAGFNDFREARYGGPCPPVGRHRYVHKLYALDRLLPALKTPTKAALETAMQGHVLGEARLVGTYQKTK